MNDLEQLAFIVEIIARLNEKGSWTGRTHIQKIAYFAQELAGVPSDYEFVIYDYGPYSFQLDAQLRELCAVGWVQVQEIDPLYGPTYHPAPAAEYLLERYGKSLERFHPHIDFIVSEFGRMKARPLEILSTLHFVRQRVEDADTDEIVSVVKRLKPLFSPSQIKSYLARLDKIWAEAQSAFSPPA